MVDGVRPRVSLQSLVVDGSVGVGALFTDAEATITDSVIRNTSSANGLYGDGVMMWSSFGMATLDMQHTLIEQSERAAVATVGAQVGVENSHLRCQAQDMIGADSGDFAYTFDDRGGNGCGCPDAEQECRALSETIQAPEPLEPVDR